MTKDISLGDRLRKKGLEATAGLVASLGFVGLSACATEARPPVTAPAVPGEASPGGPSPSEGKPASPTNPEKPDQGESDPLSPEKLWSMSEDELLEAVRIPEGTSAEEWATNLYPGVMNSFVDAVASQSNLQEWRKIKGNEYASVFDYSKDMLTKFSPAYEQLFGSKVDTKGRIRSIYDRLATGLFLREQGLDIPDPFAKFTMSGVSGNAGELRFTESLTDYITPELAELMQSQIDGLKISPLPPGGDKQEVLMKNLHWDESKKTMVPGTLVNKPIPNSN